MLTFKKAFWLTIFIFFILNILKLTIGISFWWYFPLFFSFFSLVIWGTSNIHSQFLISTFCSLPINEKLVCLTFDDGPHPINTPKILDLLKAANIKACFFIIGKNAYQFPDIIKRMDEEGHIIGNHSYSHSKIFDFYSSKRITDELLITNQVVKKIIGKELIYFRPPYGVTTLPLRNALSKLPFTVLGWSNRSFDTVKNDENRILNRIIKLLNKNKNIVLMHDTQNASVIVTEKLIQYLNSNGYKIILPSKYLKTKEYV